MSLPFSARLKNRAEHFLADAGLLSRREAAKALESSSSDQLHGDGSNRSFLRIRHQGEGLCILVLPAEEGPDDLAESRSAWLIGNHLRHSDVPLPELYRWNAETGMLLFEDLGDQRLHDLTAALDSTEMFSLYSMVIKELAHMQVAGAVDFDTDWCWDSPVYDKKLMLERESHYFLRAFWQGFLGRESVPGVDEELEDIAAKAVPAGNDCFLHRDLQSRNIMIKDGDIKFIDFQGGRMGPPGYDLASLLIDPYAGLSREMTEQLFACYMTCLGEYINFDKEQFIKHYNLLAFQRNMQIIGAFAFLYQVRGKFFFADYISPALAALDWRLQLPQFSQYPIIKGMVSKSISLLAKQGKAGKILA
ncbi:MAG: phosphotransferase [Deltaproteobacteria bacterium]|nr:phosphotransferase [Deltaproteobacteria bacterium]